MYSQRTLRRYKPDPVPDELITKLIDAAIRAPSGGNRQPWSFIIIRDAASKQKIGEWYLDAWNQTYDRIPQDQRDQFDPQFARVYRSAQYLAHHMAEAPVLILVCSQATPVPNSIAGSSHYGSIYPAVQNLLLAARAAGLGAALITLPLWSTWRARRILGLPWNVTPCAVVPLGWPLGKYGPTTRRPVEDVVSIDRYGNRAWQQGA
jgi:nitroreductase